MKRTSFELYGVHPSHFWDLPYGEALEEKKRLAKKRLSEVTDKLRVAFNTQPFDMEHLNRLNELQKDIYDAVQFNDKLLEEYREANADEDNPKRAFIKRLIEVLNDDSVKLVEVEETKGDYLGYGNITKYEQFITIKLIREVQTDA